ncbi:MAG: TRAP transporter substrate-binding protein DctP [Pseudomonadales bacterium]|nr:TRAP transporter substrate-binding protein DctP [Pseudomonadales bacterium]
MSFPKIQALRHIPLMSILLMLCSNALAETANAWLSNTTPVIKNPTAIQFRFAHPAPPVSQLPPALQKGFDWLAAKTANTLTIEQFGGGVLYGMKNGVKALRSGIADYGTCYSVGESSGFEYARTFHAPYVMPDNPYLSARILHELAPNYSALEYQKRGVQLAHIIPMRPMTLMSTSPIRTPQDLKGKRVISYMNAPGASDRLEYVELKIPFPEIYTALQQGLADVVIWSDLGFIPFKIFEHAKYYTPINVSIGTIETCINRKSFKKLSPELQTTFAEFQQKAVLPIVSKEVSFTENAKVIYTENKVEYLNLTDTEKSAWETAFEPIREDWLDECEEEGKQCRKMVQEIRNLRQKYATLTDEELIDLIVNHPVAGIMKN